MHIDQEVFMFKGARPAVIGWRNIYQKPVLDNAESSGQAADVIKKKISALDRYPVRPEVIDMLNAQFTQGQILPIDALEVQEKETSPAKAFTDGTLLNAMRYIGKQVDDDTLAAHLKDQGLGTQATRATIIERLLKSKYILIIFNSDS